MPQAILIVEDEPPMQARLRRILAGLGHADGLLHCAADMAQGQALANQAAYALALVDLGLPDGNGIELIRWLHRCDPGLPVLVISAWSTEEMILGALRAGASGYVLKERDDGEIAMSLSSVLRGGAPIDPFIARRILALIGGADAPGGNGGTAGAAVAGVPQAAGCEVEMPASFSMRERDILALIAKGLSNREIAEQMQRSRRTVESHVRHIYAKLAVNSRTQAVHLARERGLLK